MSRLLTFKKRGGGRKTYNACQKKASLGNLQRNQVSDRSKNCYLPFRAKIHSCGRPVVPFKFVPPSASGSCSLIARRGPHPP